jgi:hypothetical protein
MQIAKGAAFLGDLPANFCEIIGSEKELDRALGLKLPLKIGRLELAQRSGVGIRAQFASWS